VLSRPSADDRTHQRDHHVDFLRCRAAGDCDPSIAQGVQAAVGGTLDVADNIERVAKNARETGTTSGLMLKSAQELSEVSSPLKDEVEKFLDSVRAA
jgi:methyl-accepting chemotaxis protein